MDYYLKRADINGKTNLRNINQPKTAGTRYYVLKT